MTAAKVAAYDRRLAKITESGALSRLETRDLGATVTVVETRGELLSGVLLAYQQRLAPGLFGQQLRTTLTICTSCPKCDTDPVVLDQPVLVSIVRTSERKGACEES